MTVRKRRVTLDPIDRAIVAALVADGHLGNAALGDAVGLSPTAAARRQRQLEEAGLITGYHAALDLAALGFGIAVHIRMTLDSQSEEAMDAFETAVAASPSVTRCHLLSGAADYQVTVLARSLGHFAEVHRAELSRLPRLSHMETSFALREVVNRAVPPAALG